MKQPEQREEESVTEEVLEWERKFAGSYSSGRLLPTDPSPFTDLSGRQKREGGPQLLPLAPGWAWRGDWQVGEWQYAWNVTASSWRPRDGPSMQIRRRHWSRVRFRPSDSLAPAAVPGGQVPRELVDLSLLRVVFSCRAARSRREIAGMLGLEQTNVTLLAYTTPAAFLAAWARLFAADGGRTGRLTSTDTVLVIYDLDDVDLLCAALLPLLTESGEFRLAGGVTLLQERFSKFAVVLAGWTGPSSILIDRVELQNSFVPPIRISVARLE